MLGRKGGRTAVLIERPVPLHTTADPRGSRRRGPVRLPALAALLLAALVALTGLAASAPASVDAATISNLVARCSAVPMRASPWNSANLRKTLSSGARVTSDRTVAGGTWHTRCAGVTKTGSGWWRITMIGTRTVRSLYGVNYLYVPSSLLRVVSTVTTLYPGCDGAAIRTSATTTAKIKARLPLGAVVISNGLVAGAKWTTTCGGSSKGTRWFRITKIGGKTVKSLYGTTYVYAATGVLSSVLKAPAATPAPNPTPNPSATPSPTPTPNPAYLAGVDVSHWQGTIDWSAVAGSGIRFAFVKATEGICPTCTAYYTDATYATNRAGANAHGIVIGAYDFAQPSLVAGSAKADADYFVATAMPAMGDLAPVLDLEVTNNLSVANLTAWVKAWVAEVYAKTGVRATLYTSPAFWAKCMGGTSWFATNGYPVLWLAHWTTGQPTIPGATWGGNGWTFWQYSNQGSVPGIHARVDLDRYAGKDLSPFRIP
jgi:GH25 family lysozyme M1 (1,4-beta-N-acetylmuramidase)